MAGVDGSRVGERVKGVVIGLHWGGTCTRVSCSGACGQGWGSGPADGIAVVCWAVGL